jgi:hypothetical protein
MFNLLKQLEPYGVKLGLKELLELTAKPEKALSIVQTVVHKAFNSSETEVTEFAKQICAALPDFNVEVFANFDGYEEFEQSIEIVITKNREGSALVTV